jgi:uncharacterized protein
MTQNRLAAETSPYLLQHQDNPVHWWAWGPDALAEAKASKRPILLSIGYAACHWCHVMAHESFEDPATAAVMNELFVNIKVDREERPDIDAIYMTALHALGEQGGWPLTMFLNADALPFWGGTYFPKDERYGRPSFTRVLREIARIHKEDPARVVGNAMAIKRHLSERPAAAHPDAAIEISTVKDLAEQLANSVDPEQGGLSGAPKFPQFSVFNFLWSAGIRFDSTDCLDAVLVTLRNICQGGIYDHIGGGFARYSVDERWLIPHFEKMLYDNALLLQLLTEAFRETQDPLFAVRVRETVDWLLREMRTRGQTPSLKGSDPIADAPGGFASSYDADSEGHEGKFYVWTPAEIRDVLGQEDGDLVCKFYDITEAGNFEHGTSNPNRLAKLELEDDTIEGWLAGMRQKLFEHRAKRVAPGWDDKVLADWNGLTIVALAEAGRTFGRPDWIEAAISAFNFVSTRMVENGRLRHSYRANQLRGPGTAADYANMIAAALALHQVTGNAAHLKQAQTWAATLQKHYWVPERGGYATTADDTADVIARLETAHDDATPNANATMVGNLVKLHALTGDEAYHKTAAALVRAFIPDVATRAVGHTGLLAGVLDLHAPMQVVVVRGQSPAPKGADPMLAVLADISLPGAIMLTGADTTHILPSSAVAIDGKPTAYVCVGGMCSAPVTDAGLLREVLERQRRIT